MVTGSYRWVRWFAVGMALLVGMQVAAADGVDEQLTAKMRQDLQQAITLQRKEGKLAEAIKLLEPYTGLENVPEPLKLELVRYKTWAYSATHDDAKGREFFHRLLDMQVPGGWTKELDVSYGPYERNILDVYMPKAAKGPTPVLVLIHGGGWGGGNQVAKVLSQRDVIVDVLNHGGAVASITYRFVYKEYRLPAPLMDSARAIQFLRANAARYNLDKGCFVAMGDSAGGCNTLWLATHDDLADPNAEDPVLRESTRLQGAIGDGAQTTLDPAVMKAGGILEALGHPMFNAGLKYPNDKLKALDVNAETQRMIDFCSPVKHLDAGDPPIVLRYGGPISRTNDAIHHPKLGLIFKQRADEVGAKCTISITREDAYPPPPKDFILKMLGISEAR